MLIILPALSKAAHPISTPQLPPAQSGRGEKLQGAASCPASPLALSGGMGKEALELLLPLWSSATLGG